MHFPQRPLVSLLFLSFCTTLATSLRAEPGHPFKPVTAEQTALIEAGLPPDTFAPAQARRVLVFFRTEGFVHKSIPVGILALQRLGEKTKAFTTAASEDMAQFTPENLARFDAVVFLNSTGLKFTDPLHRQALLEFVRGGKGVIGLHAATDNFPDWPEGQALIGGVFHSHPWNAGEVSAVKLDEPKHVLNLPFGETGFWIREELYQISGPYSREKQRVLLSLDMSKTQNARPADKIKRTDNDFPVSWIHTEGKGRVFYTSLGHNEDIFYVRPVLSHLLEGIRYALGDLAADARPSAQAGKFTPALAPNETTTIQDIWLKPAAKPKAAAATDAKVSAPAATPGTETPTALAEPALIAILLDPAAPLSSKFAALDRLTLKGTAASVPALAATAVSDEPGLAERSALVLGQLRLPEAESALIKIVEKRAAGTRTPFIDALRSYRTPATFGVLSAVAKNADASDARAARAAIASYGVKSSVDFLLSLPAGPDATPLALAAAYAWLDRDAKAAPAVATLAEKLLAKATAPSDRAEAIVLLAKSLTPEKSKRLVKWLGDPEPRVRQAAAAAIVRSRQAAPIAELAAAWPKLGNDTQIAALSAVADDSGLGLARLSLDSTDTAVITVGIAALARVENTEALLALAPRLVGGGPVRDAAYRALSASQARDLSTRLTEAAGKSDSSPAVRAALLSLLGDRQVISAQALIMELCASPEAGLRAAAFTALGDIAHSVPMASIIKLSENAKKSADQRGFRKALFTSVGFVDDAAKAAELLGGAIADPAQPGGRSTFIGALTLVKGPEADTLLARLLNAPDAADRKDVIRALSAARIEGSLKLLQATAKKATNEDERILAFRGCIETIPAIENLNKIGQIAAYRSLWPLAIRSEEKNAILAAVRELKTNEAQEFLKEFKAEEPAK
ncbi:MAG: ThuA domain-containing protein [Verrucomicrobia bacterium]|nr:ThuA domain-containing protein [Verrucomicrobiota bacterium]